MAAERSLARALKLNPNHTEAYLLYGRLLEALGQLDRGLEMKLNALERDPFSALVHVQISLSYWNQRRYDDSITWATKALALDERHMLAREHLAGAYWKKRDFDRYFEEVTRHTEIAGAPVSVVETLRQVYRKGGYQGIVRHSLQLSLQHPEQASPVAMAVLHGELGELDAAFPYLERVFANHDPCLVHLGVAPQWDSLRGDARFDVILARMNLVPGVSAESPS